MAPQFPFVSQAVLTEKSEFCLKGVCPPWEAWRFVFFALLFGVSHFMSVPPVWPRPLWLSFSRPWLFLFFPLCVCVVPSLVGRRRGGIRAMIFGFSFVLCRFLFAVRGRRLLSACFALFLGPFVYSAGMVVSHVWSGL